MGDISEYKIEDPKERTMLIACDYVGSYGTAVGQDIKDARKDFFKQIIRIAKEKKHNIVIFSFISTYCIREEQLDELKESLQDEQIQKMMKEFDVEIRLGGQYRKEDSINANKNEYIIEELKDLSKKYSVTDMIVIDDVKNIWKMFVINDSIVNQFPVINIDYISLTSDFPYEVQPILKDYKRFNIYGEFTEEKINGLTDEDKARLSGLGELGYINFGLSKVLENLMSKKPKLQSIEQK